MGEPPKPRNENEGGNHTPKRTGMNRVELIQSSREAVFCSNKNRKPYRPFFTMRHFFVLIVVFLIKTELAFDSFLLK